MDFAEFVDLVILFVAYVILKNHVRNPETSLGGVFVFFFIGAFSSFAIGRWKQRFGLRGQQHNDRQLIITMLTADENVTNTTE